ncbi:hypothetical protein ACYST8_05625 [Pseudomonas inefficax]
MPTDHRSSANQKLAILPMWVIDRIKEEMRLSPGTWETITKAVEAAEVPEKTACAVRLPPATTFAAGVSVASVLMAIKQRAGFKPEFLEFTQPAPQPHPEPIAWMVDTAFWWTKEEAERDAAATGLPIVGLGPMPDAGEAARLRIELGHMRDERDDLSAKLDRFYSRTHGIKNLAAIEELSDKLADRDALLTDISKRHWSGVDFDLPADLVDRIKALSASEEPSAPTSQTTNGYRLFCKAVDDYKPGKCSCGVEIDHEIPGTSFQRLNALANQGE